MLHPPRFCYSLSSRTPRLLSAYQPLVPRRPSCLLLYLLHCSLLAASAPSAKSAVPPAVPTPRLFASSTPRPQQVILTVMTNPPASDSRRSLRTWVWRLSLAYLVFLLVFFLLSAVAERWWVTLLLTYVSRVPLVYPIVAPSYSPCAPATGVPRRALECRRPESSSSTPLPASSGRTCLVPCPPDRGCAADPQRGTTSSPSAPGPTPTRLSLPPRSDLPAGDLAVSLRHPRLRCAPHSPRMERRGPGGSNRLFALPVRCLAISPLYRDRRGAMAVRLEVEGHPLTVVTTHSTTAYPPTDCGAIGESWRSTWTIAARCVPAKWTNCLAFANSQPGPILITGDFNTPPCRPPLPPPHRRPHRCLPRRWPGTGYTFAATRPRYRIDYFFAGPGIVPISCRPLPLIISDHRPGLGEFALVENGAAPPPSSPSPSPSGARHDQQRTSSGRLSPPARGPRPGRLWGFDHRRASCAPPGSNSPRSPAPTSSIPSNTWSPRCHGHRPPARRPSAPPGPLATKASSKTSPPCIPPRARPRVPTSAISKESPATT